VAVVAEEEQQLLADIFEGNESVSLRVEVSGAVIVAHRVTAATAMVMVDALLVPVEGSSVAVKVPASLLQSVVGSSAGLDSATDAVAVVLITAYDAGSDLNLATAGEASQVHGLVSVRIFTNSSLAEPVKVAGLTDLVEVTLGTNASAGSSCAFWDEEAQAWSSEGLKEVSGGPESPLVCATNHLTLFAMIEGVFSALVCSQVRVLSREGLMLMKKMVTTQDWHRLDFLLLVGLFLSTSVWVIIGICLEWRWEMQGIRDDSMFFLPDQDENARGAPGKSEHVRSVQTESAGVGGEAAVGADDGGSGAGCLLFCCALAPDVNKLAMKKMPWWSRWLVQLYIQIVYFQVSSRLMMTNADIKLMAERARLEKARAQTEMGESTRDIEALVKSQTIARATSSTAINQLQGHVAESIKQLVKEPRYRCSRLPLLAWRLFATWCPWVTSLNYSMRMPATLSTLLLQAEILSAAMFVAIFFQASGDALAANSDPSCSLDRIWEHLGRFAVIGVVSAVGAMVPVLFVKLGHQRKFITMPSGTKALVFHPGEELGFDLLRGVVTKVNARGQAWLCGVRVGWHIDTINGERYAPGMLRERAAGESLYTVIFHPPPCDSMQVRQLRRWRMKDRVVIVLTFAYSACAFFFTSLFIASVNPLDGEKWAVAVIIGFAKKAVIMPLLFSMIMFLLGSMLMLCAASVRAQAHEALDFGVSQEEEEAKRIPKLGAGEEDPEREPYPQADTWTAVSRALPSYVVSMIRTPSESDIVRKAECALTACWGGGFPLPMWMDEVDHARSTDSSFRV
jgi:hypothetical protein